MSACETCWAEASRRALMLGGMTADHYREVLAENTRHADAETLPTSVAPPPGAREVRDNRSGPEGALTPVVPALTTRLNQPGRG